MKKNEKKRKRLGVNDKKEPDKLLIMFSQLWMSIQQRRTRKNLEKKARKEKVHKRKLRL